jgi:hypothetical protein
MSIANNSQLNYSVVFADVGKLGHSYPVRPTVLFGNKAKWAYVNNPKCGCTLAKNLLFYSNHGYKYSDPLELHNSRYAFWALGSDSNWYTPECQAAYESLRPQLFSFVRNPFDRFVSAFFSKIWRRTDKAYDELRDDLMCRANVDLSSTADPKVSILRFAEWVAACSHEPWRLDPHFRPQVLNLFLPGPQDDGYHLSNIIKLEDVQQLDAFINNVAPGFTLDDQVKHTGLPEQLAMVWSEDLANIVRYIYGQDFVAFDYDLTLDLGAQPVELMAPKLNPSATIARLIGNLNPHGLVPSSPVSA